jgi:hypothetical protein
MYITQQSFMHGKPLFCMFQAVISIYLLQTKTIVHNIMYYGSLYLHWHEILYDFSIPIDTISALSELTVFNLV